MSIKEHAEVVVIGAGPGGYAAAFRAADLGKKVLLVDSDKELGGVCLNRGCIPSKALLHISKVIEEAKGLSTRGVTFGAPVLDIDAVRSYKEKIVLQLNGGIAQMAKARNVKIQRGQAKFNSNDELLVKLENKHISVSFDHCIVAGGSVSVMVPGIPTGHPSVMTSRAALELKDIPESLMVVGGGVIGLELGQVYAALGSKITVVEFMPQLLSGIDMDLVKPLQKRLEKQFESIFVSTKVSRVIPGESGELRVFMSSNGEKIEKNVQKVLVSVGRKPNSDILCLEKTDIKVDGGGFITVDEHQRTSVHNIYAIGDIAGKPLLAHKETHEGKVAAESLCGLSASFDKKAIPSVIYTDPEIAWAGITETEAKEQGVSYKKGNFPWTANGRATVIGATDGITKIIFDSDTDKIIGIGIVGTGAGDLISEGVLAIEMGADAEDIGLTVHPHPTMSETIGNASEVVTGTVTDIYL